MLKVPLTLVLTFLIGVSTAQAATLVDFTGATTGGWATGSAIITLAPDSLSFTGTLSNTSPFDAQLTAFGFDLAGMAFAETREQYELETQVQPVYALLVPFFFVYYPALLFQGTWTEIGVALVKPAEFVIFRIQQTTGG